MNLQDTTLDQLLEITTFVIKHANWPTEIEPSACQTSELTEGMSALGVFTVECPNADFIPAKVVLKRYADKPLKNKRIMAASKAFSKVGAAPDLIACDDNWVIEAFAGEKQEPNTEISMKRMADLAARLHTAPTDWCNSWQTEMYQKHPCLQNLPVGSLVWPCLAHHDGGLDKYTAEQIRQLDEAIPKTLSKIGDGVVSIHGDLHRGNTVLTVNEVLLAIDFEFSCISQVRQDLLYSSWENGDNRRTLCSTYLKARGLLDQQEVDLLAIDMIVAAVVHFRLLRELLSVGSPLPRSGIELPQALSELNQLNKVLESLKDTPERCACVVDETDVWKCIKDIGLLLNLCTKH